MIFLWWLISYMGYEYYWLTAVSKDLVSLFNLLGLLLYIKIWNPCPESWIPWDKECLCDWSGYLKIALPIAFSFYLEGVMFETFTILAGLFPGST